MLHCLATKMNKKQLKKKNNNCMYYIKHFNPGNVVVSMLALHVDTGLCMTRRPSDIVPALYQIVLYLI